MLEPILGNSTIEIILFILESYGQAYPFGSSKMFNIPVNGIQQQMDLDHCLESQRHQSGYCK
jgi:hypothetical protein